MLTQERRSRLLEMVRVRGFASLPDLAGEFLHIAAGALQVLIDGVDMTGHRFHRMAHLDDGAVQVQPVVRNHGADIAEQAIDLFQQQIQIGARLTELFGQR